MLYDDSMTSRSKTTKTRPWKIGNRSYASERGARAAAARIMNARYDGQHDEHITITGPRTIHLVTRHGHLSVSEVA